MPKKLKTPARGLSDARLREVAHLINCSIHELVFALQHMEQTTVVPGADNSSDLEAADDCLLTVTGNIGRIQDILNKAIVRAEKEAA